MRIFLYIIQFSFFSFVCVFLLWGCGNDIQNMPPKNDAVAVFGDSLVVGVGSTEGNDFVSLLDKESEKTFFNYGVSGETTRDALDRVDEVVEKESGVVVIILGGNDVLQKLPKEETFSNLEKIVTTFQANGSVVVLVGVRSGVVGNGRDEDFKSVAKNTGSVYVSDILKDVFGKREYMSDAVHPNDAGYELIAERMLPIINQLYE